LQRRGEDTRVANRFQVSIGVDWSQQALAPVSAPPAATFVKPKRLIGR
jgi:hypothetical protein